MLKTSSFTGLLIILQSIDAADKDKVGVGESIGNETNLSNSSLSKKYTRVGYLTSKGAKTGSGNTKKGVETAKVSDYLTPAIKKGFNY